MNRLPRKWFTPSALAAALLACASGAQAAPQYSVQRTGPLCAVAQNPASYNT
jgi:alginate biosynthesis protein AlgX